MHAWTEAECFSNFMSTLCGLAADVLNMFPIKGKGWKVVTEVRIFTSNLSSLDSNHDPALNCQPGVSQAG